MLFYIRYQNLAKNIQDFLLKTIKSVLFIASFVIVLVLILPLAWLSEKVLDSHPDKNETDR